MRLPDFIAEMWGGYVTATIAAAPGLFSALAVMSGFVFFTNISPWDTLWLRWFLTVLIPLLTTGSVISIEKWMLCDKDEGVWAGEVSLWKLHKVESATRLLILCLYQAVLLCVVWWKQV